MLKFSKALLYAGALLPFITGAAVAQTRDITVVLPEALQVVDPCESASYNVGVIVKQNVVETLTELNPANGEIMPRLATSWERVDPTTWRFTLREGVKFHDGADFNAAAAAKAIERTMDTNISCMTRNKFFTPGTFAARAIDDTTLEIVTNPPQPILPTLLTTLTISSPNTESGKVTTQPIGTGPYVFESWTQGDQVVLARFDGYWGEAPEVERATFIVRNESAVRAAMVETGEADIAPSIAVNDATNPETDFSYSNTETTRLRIGTEKAPLSDVRIRKALNLAVDRQAFIGSILSPDVVPASQLVVPTTSGYNHDMQPWAYDLEQAKALIAEARADGVPVDTEIRLVGRQNIFPGVNEVLEALTQMWKAAGLNVTLQMVERVQALDMGTKPYDPDRPPTMITDQHNNDMGDASFTVIYKYSSDGPQSDTNTPALDAIIAEAASAEGDTRRQLFEDAFAMITTEVVPDVMLFHMVGYTRVGPRIEYTPTTATNSELQLAQIKFAD